MTPSSDFRMKFNRICPKPKKILEYLDVNMVKKKHYKPKCCTSVVLRQTMRVRKLSIMKETKSLKLYVNGKHCTQVRRSQNLLK